MVANLIIVDFNKAFEFWFHKAYLAESNNTEENRLAKGNRIKESDRVENCSRKL